MRWLPKKCSLCYLKKDLLEFRGCSDRFLQISLHDITDPVDGQCSNQTVGPNGIPPDCFISHFKNPLKQ